MNTKRIAMMVGMVMVALMVVQPAQAGVGGCNTRFGVGGCGQLTASGPQVEKTPSSLELLHGAIPDHVLATLMALFGVSDGGVIESPDTTDQGVGGCNTRFGVGGCGL